MYTKECTCGYKGDCVDGRGFKILYQEVYYKIPDKHQTGRAWVKFICCPMCGAVYFSKWSDTFSGVE